MRCFDFAARQYWAILTEVGEAGEVRAPHLKQILDIAARAQEPDFEAVAQKLADRASENGLLELRGATAVVNVIGPIFRYANLFTWISGATSVQELATTFRAAVDDPAVRAIVLNIDSPGGEVAGISEMASAIFDAREKKPVIAYVDALAGSGAYWLASAAGRIVANDTAELGSIGVVATLVDRAPRDGVKTYQFVSSVSPNKRPNMETDEGRATIQQRIDDLAGVFVASVAKYRGASEQKILEDFGRGGMMIAAKALAAGMADEIGTFESVMSELDKKHQGRSLSGFGGSAAELQHKGEVMDVKTPAEPTVPPKTEPGAPAAAADAIESARADGRKEGFGLAQQIFGMCALAGLTAQASLAYLKPEATLETARKEILDARASGPAVQSHILPNAGIETTAKAEDSPVVKAAEKLAAKGVK
jgi:signal peptide peptidase SppA